MDTVPQRNQPYFRVYKNVKVFHKAIFPNLVQPSKAGRTLLQQTIQHQIAPMVMVKKMTENELIQSCLRNDRLAQRRLYEKYSKAMFTIALRMSGDHDLAADILQEAFIKVFKSLARFRQESTLGAWIKTIVVRTALSKLKKQPKFDELPETDNPNTIDWGDYLEAEYLEKAIKMLPQGYRTVFSLIEIEGYSHKEVADLLGITTGTSKSQLFYAKKKLRQIISKLL